MDSQEPSAALPQDYWKPKDIIEGQRRINGQLCRVDQMLVEIIRQLILELAKFPAAARADLNRIEAMLVHAYQTSGKVAHIKPPGCEPPYTADPNWPLSSSSS
jgi:hypothetical protein